MAELAHGIAASIEALTREPIAVVIDAAGGVCAELAESHAVPVALALTELAFNAVRHKAGDGGVRLALRVDAECRAELRISNPGRLPDGFPAAAAGTGIGLVGALLPDVGSTLAWQQRDGRAEAHLALAPPLLCCTAGVAT